MAFTSVVTCQRGPASYDTLTENFNARLDKTDIQKKDQPQPHTTHKPTTAIASAETSKMKPSFLTLALAAFLALVVVGRSIPRYNTVTDDASIARYNGTLDLLKRQWGCDPMPCHDGHTHCCFGTVRQRRLCILTPTFVGRY